MPDSPFGKPGTNPPDQGIGALSKSVLDAMLSYLQARLLLLRIESKEASSAIAKRVTLYAAAGSLFTLAYFIAIAAVISLFSDKLEIRWEYIALWTAGAHAFVSIVVLLVARAHSSRSLFEKSLKELEKDRQWLQEKKSR